MIYVVAGNEAQAYEYINRKIQERLSAGETNIDDYKYVHSSVVLRGIKDPHGVFIGTWKERKDIIEIVETLLSRSVHVNPKLGKIHKELCGKDSSIHLAAKALADEIDAEVMAKICKKINGGVLESS